MNFDGSVFMKQLVCQSPIQQYVARSGDSGARLNPMKQGQMAPVPSPHLYMAARLLKDLLYLSRLS
jgi:hypothetical protein